MSFQSEESSITLDPMAKKLKIWMLYSLLENYPSNKRIIANNLSLAIKIKQKIENTAVLVS